MDETSLKSTDSADVNGELSRPTVSVRIYVPELNVQKTIQFHREELVWNVKQQCLATLPKELKESFNYGLFYPPSNGRAGKFLDEERPLSDYPFNGPGGYLELKYKRRVYKMLHLDEKQLRSLHTRVNLRRFFDYVTSGQTDKITKMCAKGLDPNIHCQETGETPLTLAATSARPGPLLLALVGGGALIDYRARCGSTALHKAAEKNNLEAVRTLLDLGASANVKDTKGLTPLWNAISAKASPMLCQALLHDYSIVGVQDAQGWHEVHQACRNGLVQHLENLLFYGAEMNAKNASGNTPLHVCAVDNQEACARLLLFRGADREALNYSNQTPYQVAVIAGNLELAALIHRFRTEEVVPFKETPSYNPRRRKSILSMRHSVSSSVLDASSIAGSSGSSGTPSPTLVYGRSSMLPRRQAPSPSPSWAEMNPMCMSTVSVRSDTGSSSSCTAESEDNTSANGPMPMDLADKISVDQCDIVSDSSGVGTSNSGSGGSYDANTPSDHSLVLPGMTVVCTEAYSCKDANHLNLQPGDIIEVTGSTDCGLLEGWLRGDNGYFPPHCVQEVKLRHPAAIAAARQHPPGPAVNHHPTKIVPNMALPGVTTVQLLPVLPLGKTMEARAAGRREMSSQHYGTTPRSKSIKHGEPRTVILHKGQRGFGFVLRGAKTMSGMKEQLHPLQNRVPALQYLDSVEAGSVADRAGLRPGDFILAINGEDLAQASHETVVDCIRRSGNLVTLTICSAVQTGADQSVVEYATAGPSSRQYSTLPRKLPGRPPQPPKRDPRTTLSVGRARACSMVVALAEMDSSIADGENGEEIYSNSSSRTASIRSRSGSGRVSTTDLERLSIPTAVDPPAPPMHSPGQSSPRTPRVYASVAEMKRMRKLKGSTELLKMHKDFHSTPELCWEQVNGQVMTSSWAPETGAEQGVVPEIKSHSQDDVYDTKKAQKNNSRRSWAVSSKKKKSGSHPPPGTRYHGSWHSIEDSYNQPEDGDDDDEETEEEDNGGDDEDAVTPVADQQLTILGGSGEYRAVKPCRPIYSSSTLPKRAGSPHCNAPPPNHPPPPPPPPSQVVRLDMTKSYSEYAVSAAAPSGDPRPTTPVMSSFRPADNAKLYALPEDAKGVGYSTLRPSSSAAKKPPPSPSSAGSSSSSSSSSLSSSASRSKSLPPRSVRPNVAIKQSNNEESTNRVSLVVNSTPIIPDPDYESDDDGNNKPQSRLRIEIKQENTSTLPKSQSFCSDILKAKSLLKTSQSYPDELSDCQAPPDVAPDDSYVTFVPVNNGKQSDTDSYDGRTSRVAARTNGGTRHAVSLIQLPPPAENGEPDDPSAHMASSLPEQDSVSTVSTLSSLSTNSSSNSSDRDATVMENRPSSNPINRNRVTINGHWKEDHVPKKATDADRTIEESLQLIRKHVDELSGMNHHQRPPSGVKKSSPPIVPQGPPLFDPDSSSDEFLPPPPPEFSDGHHPKSYYPFGSRTLPKSMSSGQLRGTLGDADDHSTPVSSSSHFLNNRRIVERRLSDDALSHPVKTVRVVAAVPKKQVTFSSDVIDAESSRGGSCYGQQIPPGPALMTMRHFSSKPLREWTIHDTADWLDSLFLNEYKTTFMKKNMDGQNLLRINNDMLVNLGVKRVGHRLNIEKSLKHYARDPEMD